MSSTVPTSAVTTTADASHARLALRNLYVARLAFALVWAAALATQASTLNALTVTLLVVYPLADLAAALYDLRTSAAGARRALLTNLALSLAAAVGLAIAASSEIPDVLRVWGLWAVTAGAVQLILGVQRRGLGGQWPMILSGGISVLAGGSFLAMASGQDPSLAGLAGYATLGGLFFGASALRLHRALGSSAG